MLSQSKIDKFHNSYTPVTESGCWLWDGNSATYGYGAFIDRASKLQYAHRASWIIHKGEIPNGLHVLHKCDIPACVNPNHLFLGTHADNMRDMFRKNRRKSTSLKGDENSSSKVTTEQVLEIRNGIQNGVYYAKKFGITRATVCDIRKRRTWKHI